MIAPIEELDGIKCCHRGVVHLRQAGGKNGRCGGRAKAGKIGESFAETRKGTTQSGPIAEGYKLLQS